MSVTRAAVELLKVLSDTSTNQQIHMASGTYRLVSQEDAERIRRATADLRDELASDLRALKEIA